MNAKNDEKWKDVSEVSFEAIRKPYKSSVTWRGKPPNIHNKFSVNDVIMNTI